MTTTAGLTADLTLGALVSADPGRARVLERLGLDYCCGGQQTLREACADAGLDESDALAALAQAPSEPAVDWDALSLTEFAARIVETHHAYLWDELPRLSALVDKVARVHGGNHAELAELRTVYEQLRGELEPHMRQEEDTVFPLVRGVEAGTEPTDAPRAHIENLLAEHDAAGDLLARLNQLSDGYSTPADGCASYRAMMTGLAQLEHDTHLHIHLENNELFPRTLKLISG